MFMRIGGTSKFSAKRLFLRCIGWAIAVAQPVRLLICSSSRSSCAVFVHMAGLLTGPAGTAWHSLTEIIRRCRGLVSSTEKKCSPGCLSGRVQPKVPHMSKIFLRFAMLVVCVRSEGSTDRRGLISSAVNACSPGCRSGSVHNRRQ